MVRDQSGEAVRPADRGMASPAAGGRSLREARPDAVLGFGPAGDGLARHLGVAGPGRRTRPYPVAPDVPPAAAPPVARAAATDPLLRFCRGCSDLPDHRVRRSGRGLDDARDRRIHGSVRAGRHRDGRGFHRDHHREPRDYRSRHRRGAGRLPGRIGSDLPGGGGRPRRGGRLRGGRGPVASCAPPRGASGLAREGGVHRIRGASGPRAARCSGDPPGGWGANRRRRRPSRAPRGPPDRRRHGHRGDRTGVRRVRPGRGGARGSRRGGYDGRVRIRGRACLGRVPGTDGLEDRRRPGGRAHDPGPADRPVPAPVRIARTHRRRERRLGLPGAACRSRRALPRHAGRGARDGVRPGPVHNGIGARAVRGDRARPARRLHAPHPGRLRRPARRSRGLVQCHDGQRRGPARAGGREEAPGGGTAHRTRDADVAAAARRGHDSGTDGGSLLSSGPRGRR